MSLSFRATDSTCVCWAALAAKGTPAGKVTDYRTTSTPVSVCTHYMDENHRWAEHAHLVWACSCLAKPSHLLLDLTYAQLVLLIVSLMLGYEAQESL